VKLWDPDTGALLETMTAHTQAVVAVAFSPDGRWLASGGDDSSIKLWRMPGGTIARTLTGGTDHVYTLAFSPDGKWLASGRRERGALGTLWKHVFGTRENGEHGITVRLWRVSDGALQQSLTGHSDDARSVAFSPEGAWLATGSEDRTAMLWSLF
jgi:WD40 repeat protein